MVNLDTKCVATSYNDDRDHSKLDTDDYVMNTIK